MFVRNDLRVQLPLKLAVVALMVLTYGALPAQERREQTGRGLDTTSPGAIDTEQSRVSPRLVF